MVAANASLIVTKMNEGDLRKGGNINSYVDSRHFSNLIASERRSRDGQQASTNDLNTYPNLHRHDLNARPFAPTMPLKDAENKALGEWVNTQRAQYRKFKAGKHSQITIERVNELDAVGFVWHPGQGHRGP